MWGGCPKGPTHLSCTPNVQDEVNPPAKMGMYASVAVAIRDIMKDKFEVGGGQVGCDRRRSDYGRLMVVGGYMAGRWG